MNQAVNIDFARAIWRTIWAGSARASRAAIDAPSTASRRAPAPVTNRTGRASRAGGFDAASLQPLRPIQDHCPADKTDRKPMR